MSEPRRLLADRYEVGDLIGRGGMADVHLGYDTRLGREVAIKILRSELARDPSFLMRFRREAQSAASLNHPSIVAVFDSGEEHTSEPGGAQVTVPFIVMEYVRGQTLREIIAEQGPMEPHEAARLMTQVLRALDYSHEHGIIHRDVKPANVMVSGGLNAKVMDFGIARAIADTAATMTNTSIVVGTAQYLSPEQAQGRDVEAGSDLYSAGCLLYELLTGRPPFIGDSPVAIAFQHVGEPPQPPSVHAPQVPPELDVVVLHALAKDPAVRYQSGADFAADLDAVMEGDPTLAAKAAVAAGTMAPPTPKEPETGPVPRIVDPAEVAGDGASGHRPKWPYLVGLLALLGIILGVLFSNGFFDSAPAVIAVPNVVDKSEKEAKAALTAAGFQVATTPVKDRAKAGTVVAQQPAAQAQAPPQSVVRLSISSGPGMVAVPDLRNYEQGPANERLRALGLQMGDVTTVDSYTVDQGKVVSTDPKIGTKVAEGTVVKLALSSGKVAVPNVLGMSERKAADTLSEVGLRYTPVYVDSTKKPGTVVEQNYVKGTKVPVGDSIQLAIARQAPKSPPTQTVTVTPTPAPAPAPSRGDSGDNSSDGSGPDDGAGPDDDAGPGEGAGGASPSPGNSAPTVPRAPDKP
ncbi:Stk1 family PASTA domain-containing Ser/Thr kinase [Gephyromycinifex aptenodytis]|uniref:Stk1 family PASTA domain-containing Ser/Thr kinase n=1 Tax=Gephyromycinifex aptenodytis TaxID=2716227 RepID=UPI0014479390|nr:Stk1 family PASTA domain-containing Ser/Thr kinase [Gephyromycinifex aptenodytis]